MIGKAQASGIAYDPFASPLSVLDCIAAIGVQAAGEKHREFFRSFARTYGVDYCPVYSILGSVISQEVIKVVESKQCEI